MWRSKTQDANSLTVLFVLAIFGSMLLIVGWLAAAF